MQLQHTYNRPRFAGILSMDDIQRAAPSVFATQPWHETSEHYRFIPTSTVLAEAFKQGFVCVKAGQAKTRIEGKGEFTKHVLRLRHQSQKDRVLDADGNVPEIVLMNSHDRTSGYVISAGIFRTVCENGLIVCSAKFEEIRVRHMGSKDLVSEVIEGTFKVLEQAPLIAGQIDTFKGITLDQGEQKLFAETALELRDTALEIDPRRILQPWRNEDNVNGDGSRDLWRTMNTVQESLIRGGQRGLSAGGTRRSRLRGVKSVDADNKLNRALWQLTEKMAELKTGTSSVIRS